MQKSIKSIIHNTSIKQRIWIGFCLILAILAFVGLSTLNRFVYLNNGISTVTEEIQPVVSTAQYLEAEIEASSNALGLFLLTKDTAYEKNYVEHLDSASQLVEQLTEFKLVVENDEYSKAVFAVKSNLEKFTSYKERMISLAKNDTENIPAQRIGSEKLNPAVQQLQSLISQMITSDYEEDYDDGSRETLRQALYDLRYYNVQLVSELRTFLAFRGQVSIDNINSFKEVVNTKLKIVEGAEELYTFEQEDAMENFAEILNNYFNGLDDVIKIHSTDNYRTDIFLMKSEIGPLMSQIETELGQLVSQLKEVITNTSNELQNEASVARNKVMLGVAIGVIIGLAIAFMMVRMITLPINEAVLAMDDLAKGEGDLTRRLDASGRSEIAVMSGSFNSFASKVQGLVSRLAIGVEELLKVVSDVSNIVDKTQQGSKQQSLQVEEVATAITQMAATVQEVAANAGLAADSAQQADDNAKSGQEVVNTTVSSINSLATEIETGANVINKLSQDSVSIGSVLDVIKGIAEQTNLLALNAAIEAARAGDQGRGFAVVADEVRTLASRTQESTAEIESMIQELQVQAKAAVEVIEEGREMAKTSVSHASDAGKALNEITQSVATISDMNIQIATASEQQSAVAGEINSNIYQISNVVDENEESSNQLSVASHQLADLASELQQLVSQFKY